MIRRTMIPLLSSHQCFAFFGLFSLSLSLISFTWIEYRACPSKLFPFLFFFFFYKGLKFIYFSKKNNSVIQ